MSDNSNDILFNVCGISRAELAAWLGDSAQLSTLDMILAKHGRTTVDLVRWVHTGVLPEGSKNDQ